MDYSVHVLKTAGDVNEILGEGFASANAAMGAFHGMHVAKTLVVLGPADEKGVDGEPLTRPSLLWQRDPGMAWSRKP